MEKQATLPNMGGNTLSQRLTAQLIEELRTGAFSTAERMPSETQLAEQYKVSRSVIRDVMSNLEQAGFVSRARGVGTVIHRDIVRLANRFDLKFEYNTLIRSAGCIPGTDMLRLHTAPATPRLAETLGVPVGESLIVCEKRLLASGRPVIYSVDHLPESRMAGLDWQHYDWSVPIFDLLADRCNIVVDTDITALAVTMGPPEVREKLQLAEDQPLFALDEVGYYKLTRPILHTDAWYTDFFKFSILRKKY